MVYSECYYSDEDIRNWLHKTVGINKVVNRCEVIINCPFCGHPRFYFNIEKQVGHCKRASCGRSPKLSTLIQKLGSSPVSSRWIPTPTSFSIDVTEHANKIGEVLPKPVIVYSPSSQKYITNYLMAYDYLKNRNLTNKDMTRFDIRADSERVYVPVKNEEGITVQYVGRSYKPGTLRYKYAKGVPINNFILGWGESKLWPEITFVENSFVAIWLRNYFHCSTNFGSHLSDIQIDLIKNSSIKSVGLMWDQGAELKAEKAVKQLRECGIPAAYAMIKGQPDDHSISYLKHVNKKLHEAALNNNKRISHKDIGNYVDK